MCINKVAVAHHGLILCVRGATACPDLLDIYFAQERHFLIDVGIKSWISRVGGSGDPKNQQQILIWPWGGAAEVGENLSQPFCILLASVATHHIYEVVL